MSTTSSISRTMTNNGGCRQKLKGFEFFEKTLRSPRLVVAPMVDQSEYAWRILSRRYGAELCYTPMFHARLFAESAQYREENFTTGPDDRPLIVQFCANDPDYLLQAAKLVENDCAAVDINLGCPQHIAKRGHYGAFLMEEWGLIASMIRKLDQELAVPVTCKIRVFEDVNKTVAYAKMIEAAGCQLLTVHGRTREMKGHKTGIADWEQIRIVKENVKIPVFANGNILYKEDVERCIKATGVDGVMTAEGNLYNPALFSGVHYPVWKLAIEYLEICRDVKNSANPGMMRAHLFKIFAPCLADHPDLRTDLGNRLTWDAFWSIAHELKDRLLQSNGNVQEFTTPTEDIPLNSKGHRILPNWVCQPHFRPELPEQGANQESENSTSADSAEAGIASGEVDEARLAILALREEKKEKKRKQKEAQAEKLAQKKAKRSETNAIPLCTAEKCGQLASAQCSFKMCKTCCRGQPGVVVGATTSEELIPFLCEFHKTRSVTASADA